MNEKKKSENIIFVSQEPVGTDNNGTKLIASTVEIHSDSPSNTLKLFNEALKKLGDLK